LNRLIDRRWARVRIVRKERVEELKAEAEPDRKIMVRARDVESFARLERNAAWGDLAL
jgi:hypothetical protein